MSPIHFFLTCPVYAIPRADVLQEVTDILQANDIIINFGNKHFREQFVEVLLRGTRLIGEDENKQVPKLAESYIKKQRFP